MVDHDSCARLLTAKPNPGAKEATLVGEIVDFSCYLQIGKHGEKHRVCAQKCFTAGQPIGLLTKDGSLYMLMEEEHDPRRDGLTNSASRGGACRPHHGSDRHAVRARRLQSPVRSRVPEEIARLP